jgi:hypothetical protein
MKTVLTALVLATIALPHVALSQTSSKPRESGIYLTIFRSPSTGVEVRSGHVAGNVGFYPTVLRKDGKRDNANFIRLGGSYYLKDRGSSVYVSPSVVFSLDKDWEHGALTELGFRGTLYRALRGRVGVGVLTTIDGYVRVNPTVGMDVKLGRGR